MFWIIAATTTGLCIFALLHKLARPSFNSPAESDAAIALYQAQRQEIERQSADGLLGPLEAKGALTEAARGLLSASAAEPFGRSYDPRRLRAAAVLLIILVPAVWLPAYSWFGTPGMPDFVLAGRTLPDPAEARIDELVKQLTNRIATNPGEIRGRELLVPLYLRLGRLNEALDVLGDLIQIGGDTAPREADRGEILTAAADGVVTAEAKAAFEVALKLDSKLPKARYYMAKAAVQDGDKVESARLFSNLLADLPVGSPVHRLVESELAELSAPSPAPTNAAGDAAKPDAAKPEGTKP